MTDAYAVPFIESEPLCGSTASFRFGKPEGYGFEAGQYFSVTLATEKGHVTEDFSHSNAPADDCLELTTRLTGSPFKNALQALKPGDEVNVAGPNGRFILPEGLEKAAFLAGGVGVTPCRSIVRDAVRCGSGLELLVFYGTHDQSCVPFRDEFDSYEARDPRIRVVEVLESPTEPWPGERGPITAEIVRRHCDPLDGWHWFVSGPPAMMTAMQKVQADLGLPPERVTRELFLGYA